MISFKKISLNFFTWKSFVRLYNLCNFKTNLLIRFFFILRPAKIQKQFKTTRNLNSILFVLFFLLFVFVVHSVYHSFIASFIASLHHLSSSFFTSSFFSSFLHQFYSPFIFFSRITFFPLHVRNVCVKKV